MTPKFALKSLSEEENQGTVQPIRFLYCRMFCIGARGIAAKEVPRAHMTQVSTLSRYTEQPSQPAEGQPPTPGARMQ